MKILPLMKMNKTSSETSFSAEPVEFELVMADHPDVDGMASQLCPKLLKVLSTRANLSPRSSPYHLQTETRAFLALRRPVLQLYY